MKTVAIICEYNPFHNGHKHHIDQIRRELGEDTRIIAIMSGGFTQRGESAVMDKGDRARAAVECGVNLVLELPFPYSASSAELFARAGVSIADSIGIVDLISFGSESGDISALTEYATLTASDEYEELVAELLDRPENAALGYPCVCEIAFNRLYGEKNGITLTPNNILAIEYIKALKSFNSKIKPHTVLREGAAFNEDGVVAGSLQSASAIRKELLSGNISVLEYIPDEAKPVVLDAIRRGAFPCDMERLSPAVLSFFRLSPSDAGENFHDAKGGLYNRLKSASLEADNISALVRLSETKKFTNARILRAVWCSFFGVTSSDVRTLPEYTQILALDGIGRACLKEIREQSRISVLTKPTDTFGLSDTARGQKALSDRADSIFHLTRPRPVSGAYSLTYTPFVKKD